ncbi:MAG: NADH:ubiquinone reductase (Na(+)-transporting) subunit C [Bacteroidales bacterium]
MKDFSNKYIMIFSVVMIVSVAILLSLTAMLLQPRQEKNVEVEKKMNILSSINVTSTKTDAVELYDRYIKESYVINTDGRQMEGVNPFTVSLRAEQKKSLAEQSLPVFIAVADNGDTLHIFPLEGKGLWGPIWGYVALEEDMVTIDGVTFDHKGETPGLGAEINTTEFESQFPGKNLYRDGKFVGVKVLKGRADPQSRYEVDGISGGTITSKGLEDMVYDGLIKYEKYLSQNRK